MDFVVINPTPIEKIATKMKIDVNVALGEKAYIRVTLFEQHNEFNPLETKMIVLEGEEYKAWGNDDQYIKDIVYKELGLLPLEKVVEEQIIVDA